jgi:hypothetical protein
MPSKKLLLVVALAAVVAALPLQQASLLQAVSAADAPSEDAVPPASSEDVQWKHPGGRRGSPARPPPNIPPTIPSPPAAGRFLPPCNGSVVPPMMSPTAGQSPPMMNPAGRSVSPGDNDCLPTSPSVRRRAPTASSLSEFSFSISLLPWLRFISYKIRSTWQ